MKVYFQLKFTSKLAFKTTKTQPLLFDYFNRFFLTVEMLMSDGIKGLSTHSSLNPLSRS
jgi:hypothetical protein